jgi:hypothetical protein
MASDKDAPLIGLSMTCFAAARALVAQALPICEMAVIAVSCGYISGDLSTLHQPNNQSGSGLSANNRETRLIFREIWQNC